MSRKEIIFVPMGDTLHPHPPGVCSQTLGLRNKILQERDQEEGIFHLGTCTPCFPHSVVDRGDPKVKA